MQHARAAVERALKVEVVTARLESAAELRIVYRVYGTFQRSRVLSSGLYGHVFLRDLPFSGFYR